MKHDRAQPDNEEGRIGRDEPLLETLVESVRDAKDGRREDEHVRHRVPELGHVVGDLKQAILE